MAIPVVAADEAEEAGDVFVALDANRDGRITSDEVVDAQRAAFARLLRVGDKNKDGVLTRSEFVGAITPDERPVVQGGDFGGPGRRPQGGDPRQAFNNLDRNQDGKLTKGELPPPLRPRFEPVFRRLGKEELTRDEFVEAARRAQNPDPQQVKRLIEDLDKDGDGGLSVAEAGPQRGQFVRFLLRRVGKGADDSLTMADLAKLRPANPPAGNRDFSPEQVIKRLDRDKDGVLSRDETQGPMRAAFSRIDANGDGTLDLKELAAAARRRRQAN